MKKLPEGRRVRIRLYIADEDRMMLYDPHRKKSNLPTVDGTVIGTILDSEETTWCIAQLVDPLSLDREGISPGLRHLTAHFLLLRLLYSDDKGGSARSVPPFEGKFFDGFVRYLSDPKDLPPILSDLDRRSYPYLCEAVVRPLEDIPGSGGTGNPVSDDR